MAIMYVLTVTDSRGAGPFPPSVITSDWYNNFLNYAGFYGLGGNGSYVWSLIFNDEADYDAWFADYGLKDLQLKNDLVAWSNDQGVIYDHKFLKLPQINLKGVF